MYYKLIACSVLQREFSLLASRCSNTIDITTVRQQYHETPAFMTRMLQEEIDRIDNNTDPHTTDLTRRDIDAILLGYGLCSNAVVGLHSKKYPIVIPKAHDCATLVIGSREAYQQYFETYKGSYFFTRGWYELGEFDASDSRRMEQLRQLYMEKYEDEDIVDELMELELELTKNYKYITYVDWPALSDGASRQCAKDICAARGWTYNEMLGSDSLLDDLLEGRWDPKNSLSFSPVKLPNPLTILRSSKQPPSLKNKNLFFPWGKNLLYPEGK